MNIIDAYIKEAKEQAVQVENRYAALAAQYGESEAELMEQYEEVVRSLDEKYGVCLTPWADSDSVI